MRTHPFACFSAAFQSAALSIGSDEQSLAVRGSPCIRRLRRSDHGRRRGLSIFTPARDGCAHRRRTVRRSIGEASRLSSVAAHRQYRLDGQLDLPCYEPGSVAGGADFRPPDMSTTGFGVLAPAHPGRLQFTRDTVATVYRLRRQNSAAGMHSGVAFFHRSAAETR